MLSKDRARKRRYVRYSTNNFAEANSGGGYDAYAIVSLVLPGNDTVTSWRFSMVL